MMSKRSMRMDQFIDMLHDIKWQDFELAKEVTIDAALFVFLLASLALILTAVWKVLSRFPVFSRLCQRLKCSSNINVQTNSAETTAPLLNTSNQVSARVKPSKSSSANKDVEMNFFVYGD